jgi:hypothetical protein
MYFFLLLLGSLIAFVVSFEINKFFMFDRRCFANCWFKKDSCFYDIFNNPNFYLGFFSMFVAIVMVGLTYLKLYVISTSELFALILSTLLTIIIFKWIKFKHLKPEANAVHIKSLIALLGAFFGVVILFGFIMFNVPDFDITKDIYQNIKNDTDDIVNSSSQIINLYSSFNIYISNFSWYGMLKLSDTFHTGFVVFAWIIFVFSSIGFFATFNFIVLVIFDLLKPKKIDVGNKEENLDIKDEEVVASKVLNNDNSGIKKYQTEIGMGIAFCILSYGIYIMETSLKDQKILNATKPQMNWNASINSTLINQSMDRLQKNIVDEIQPYKSFLGFETPFEELDEKINGYFTNARRDMNTTIINEEKRFKEELINQLKNQFTDTYYFGNTSDSDKKVHEYIWINNKK